MFTKEKIYNIFILVIYIAICFSISNHTEIKKMHINRNIKSQVKIPREENKIGNITIGKINLEKPLYKIDSKKNNVDENVTILKESTLPDKENSLLLIAAHSGNSNVSYFENLDKLEKNDKIKITYLNKEYLYIVTNIWEENKNGYIHINKEYNKQLVLTTCSPSHQEKQLVINSKLIN